MKDVLKPLAKSVLIPLGITTATSATDAAIHRKRFGSGNTILIITKEEINDIKKIVNLLEESGLLMKEVSQTMKRKRKKEDFLQFY